MPCAAVGAIMSSIIAAKITEIILFIGCPPGVFFFILMLQSPDISVTSPLNLTRAFDSTDSSQRVPVSHLTGKRQSFFLHIAHIAAKTSSHFEKKRIHLPECSCVFQSVIRPSFRQICSSTVRKSSLSKRTLGTDSVTGSELWILEEGAIPRTACSSPADTTH